MKDVKKFGTRWAADFSNRPYGHVTSFDLVRWMDHSFKNKNFTERQAVEEMMTQSEVLR